MQIAQHVHRVERSGDPRKKLMTAVKIVNRENCVPRISRQSIAGCRLRRPLGKVCSRIARILGIENRRASMANVNNPALTLGLLARIW